MNLYRDPVRMVGRREAAEQAHGARTALLAEPRQHTFVAVAVVGAAAVATAATAYGSMEEAKSVEAANKANMSDAEKMNLANYNLNQENRGAKGNANYAMYAKTADGKGWEPQMFQDARGVYNQVNALAPTGAEYEAIANQAGEAQAGAMQSVNDLYSGKTQEQLLADQAGVSAGRVAAAYVNKGSALEALAATINEISAINSKKGFKGEGMGKNMLNFEARRQAYGAGASGLAGANLANKQDEQRIKAGMIQTKLGSGRLAYDTAKSGAGIANLASDAMVDRTGKAQGLFNPFRLGQSNFQYGQLPEHVAVPSMGQSMAEGVAAGANSIGSYYGSKRMMPTGAAPASVPDTGTYGGRTALQQANYEHQAIDRYG